MAFFEIAKRLALGLLIGLTLARPVNALDPTDVFANGKAELTESRFHPARNAFIVQGDAPLHVQVEDRQAQSPPAVLLRFFNGTPAPSFALPKVPVGPIRTIGLEVLPARNGSPAETRITLTLSEKVRFQSSLSPDTRQAVLRLVSFSGEGDGLLPRRIVVRHLEYGNARDISNVLAMMVPQGNGRVAADESRNNLVIDNTNGDFDALEATIADLDRPSRQVVLEAQVVEVNQAAARNLGFSFSPNVSTTFSEQAPEGSGFGSQPIPMQPFVRTGLNMQVTLNALQSSGQAKILANPRVAALEGEESKIVTGERIPYFVTQVSGNQVFQIKEDFLAGVELRITPRVNEGRLVTTRIQTNVSTITGTTPQGYPQLSTRESQAVIRVGAGQTIVIGGLLQEREIELMSGLPFVSDLPVLGALFSSRQKDRVKTELMVFITPHILSDE